MHFDNQEGFSKVVIGARLKIEEGGTSLE